MSRPIGIQAHRVLNILLSIALAAAGLCFIGGCLYIYNVEGAYSREIVAAVFQKIAVPVYIALALIVISVVWELFTPSWSEYRKTPKDYAAMLARLHDTRMIEDNADAIKTEQTRRRRGRVLCLLTDAVGAAAFLWYAVQPSHYTEDINASVIRAMWVAVPCFVIPAAVTMLTAHQAKKSCEREIALLREQPKAIRKATEVPALKPRSAARVIALLVATVAVAALIYGYVTGGTVDVLTKAINICTECIGLG